ncbi:MAG: DUF642 domain-containing protein [Alphaproteobacteria bacterium]|nr:DUF642 domain-containing protein [Alphaproteobacteria bacterium]
MVVSRSPQFRVKGLSHECNAVPVITAAILLAGASGASANLIANGSFETPTVPAGGFTNFAVGSASLTGWTVFGPAGTNVSIVSGSFSQNGVSFPAEDGNQWLDLTGDGSNSTEGVSQTIATTAGDQYQLSYFVGNTTGGGIFGTTSTVHVSLNGVLTFSDTNSNVSPTTQNWQQFTHTLVATGASITFAFQNADPPGDNNNGLDNVVLIDLGPAPPSVPEPASSGVLVAALAGFALIRRRLHLVSRSIG